MTGKIFLDQMLGDSPAEAAFQRALGRNVILWGRLEGRVIETIRDLWTLPGPVGPSRSSIPSTFSDLMTEWEKAHRARPDFADRLPRALTFKAEALRVAKLRHDMIHSAIDSFNGEMAGAFARRYQTIDKATTVCDFPLLTSDLLNLEREIVALYRLTFGSGLRSMIHSSHARAAGAPEGIPVTRVSRGPA